jgi:spoIIIJ-associated protein
VYELATIEAIGSDVEDAIARGLEALNATREQVTIEVLDQGSKAAPGQRVREARVRLTMKESQPTLAPKPPVAEQKASPAGPAMSDEQVLPVAQQVLQEMLDQLKVKASVVARWAEAVDEQDEEEGPPLVLDIRGDDLGVLIGRRGETLSALQYLTRLIVSSKAHQGVNLVVDVEGYKARREQQLRQLALRIAERVASTRKPIALEPMPAYERRIVHLTLRDHPVVTTESVGRDEDRKVTIILRSRRRS